MIYKHDFGLPWQQMSGLMRRLLLQTERAHRKAIERSGKNLSSDLITWGQRFLPEHFKQPPSQMHRWLAEQFDTTFLKRGVKLNVLAPRGSAKSTLATLAYPLREALEKREPYIWLISDTMSQAHAHLDNVKVELTSNDAIANEYPEAFGKGNVWRSSGIMLRNGTVIEAYGTGQRLRGRRRREHRPSLIVCDDLQNDEHITSASSRDHSRAWFYGTLLKAGNTQSNVVNLATALHQEAIGLELTRRPGWVSHLFRAIENWPTNMSLWETWESLYANCDNPNATTDADAFYQNHHEMLHEGATVLWPEVEDLLTLMKMRAEGGRTAFEREKQNSPVNPDHCEWPESYFDESIWFEQVPDNTIIRTMALDPSKGHDASRGDFSAYIMLQLDANGLFYVDADLARRPVPEIIDTGVEHYKTFQPDLFGVEANQFQQLLCNDFERAFAEHGMPHVLPYPITNRTNKIVRIRRLGQLLAKRRLRFQSNSPSTRLLVDQLKMFPQGDHDDGPDALEMALRLAEMMLHGNNAVDTIGEKFPISFA